MLCQNHLLNYNYDNFRVFYFGKILEELLCIKTMISKVSKVSKKHIVLVSKHFNTYTTLHVASSILQFH